MKKIIFFFLLILPFFLNAQELKYGAGAVPVKNGVVVFTIIGKADRATKDQLYTRAKMALAEMFVSAKDVIQMDSRDDGIIIVKGKTEIITNSFMAKIKDIMSFTLKISVKDGKYKCDLYDITLELQPGTKNAVKCYGENIVDEKALNKDGECKKTGYGKQRRMIIDEKDRIFDIIISKMSYSDPTENDNW